MSGTRPKNSVSVPVQTLALTDAGIGARGRRSQVPTFVRTTGENEGVWAGLTTGGESIGDAAVGGVTFAPQAAATSTRARPTTIAGPRQRRRWVIHRVRALRNVVSASMTPPPRMARSAPSLLGFESMVRRDRGWGHARGATLPFWKGRVSIPDARSCGALKLKGHILRALEAWSYMCSLSR